MIYFAVLLLSLNMPIFFYVGAIFSLISVKPSLVLWIPLFSMHPSTFNWENFHCWSDLIDQLQSEFLLHSPDLMRQRETISQSLPVSVLWGLPLYLRKHLMQFKYCVSFLQTKHLYSHWTITVISPRYTWLNLDV